MVLGFAKWVATKGGKKVLETIIKPKPKPKKSTFIKDKSGTITGVKPGKSASKIKKEAVSESSKIHDKWEKRGWKQ